MVAVLEAHCDLRYHAWREFHAVSGRQAPLLRTKNEKPRDLLRIEQELSDALTAAVEIRVKRRTLRGEQGEVAIAFGSLDELNGILEKLGLSAR